MAGILAHLEDYSHAVVDGQEIACKKFQWAALRFLADLEKRGTWRWEFDEQCAEKYFQWMRLFKHEKGPLAGLTKEPVPYELFVYANIYGWIDGQTEARRFRRSYEQLARKQAKSQDKAIQALYEISAFGEPSAEAYVAATKKEQTRFVWGAAKWLYEHSDLLKESFTCKYDAELLQKVIKHKKSGSFFSRLSKDDGKKGDGSNPHFMILDEYHLHETTEYYDLATSGMKTRKNPLLSIITTAGFELNNPCYRVEYDYVSKIIDPNNPIENDRYFVAICELDRNDTDEKVIAPDGREIEPGGIIDDMQSDEAITKANPVTGADPTTRENIRIEVAEARDKPEKMRDVKTKTFNIWVNERSSGYMNMGKWGACAVEPDALHAMIGENTDRRCWVGLDLSAKIDLTSVALEFRSADEYYILSHSFMPEESYLARLGEDKVPYDVWRANSFLTVTSGAVVDYKAVVDYVVQLCKMHGYKTDEWCLDPWGAVQVSADLIEAGEKPIDVIQGIKTLSEPVKNFREMVYAGKVRYARNPLLTWSMGNVVTRQDHNLNFMLDKDKSKQRIDPAAAIINAHYRAMSAVVSTYAKRGLRSLS
jgi:phage terminase large subunit-like protein